MSKFGKKKKGMPAVNTASLPDIVFMLLFFFMVTTVMRETDLQIENPSLPNATEVKKLEHKSLVSTIYVGKAKDTEKFGGGDKNDAKDNSPSLDRIDPNIGYVKGNVHWISNRVNRMKSDQTLEMVIKLGNWAEKIQKEGIESARVYKDNL